MELENSKRSINLIQQISCWSTIGAVFKNVALKNRLSEKTVCFSCSSFCTTPIYINSFDRFISFFLNISVGKTNHLSNSAVLCLQKSDFKQRFFVKKRYLSQNSLNNTNRYDKTHNHIDRLAVSVRGIGFVTPVYSTEIIETKSLKYVYE